MAGTMGSGLTWNSKASTSKYLNRAWPLLEPGKKVMSKLNLAKERVQCACLGFKVARAKCNYWKFL